MKHEIFKAKLIEKAVLVGLRRGNAQIDLAESMAELRFLAESAGAEVVGEVTQKSGRPRPSHLIGKGKLEETSQIIGQTGGNLVIFDDDLSPAQVRNLESALQTKVIDRSILILDVFARRARTVEARTQVELAQMKYLYPRLTRRWSHLSKQEGGIGTRGPGETQLEVDRRLVGKRIKRLSAKLNRIDRERNEQRKGRRDLFKVALVGYTNAGKSTLFNLLTRADVFVDDRLFATLDSTTRILYLADAGRVLLTDTIGFIRKLPPSLVASFRATLAEITDADLLLHVVDCAAPNIRHVWEEVEKTLVRIGSADINQLVAVNKIDVLNGGPPPLTILSWDGLDLVAISARDGVGIDSLTGRMRQYYHRWQDNLHKSSTSRSNA